MSEDVTDDSPGEGRGSGLSARPNKRLELPTRSVASTKKEEQQHTPLACVSSNRMHAAKKLAKRGSGYFSHEKKSSGTTGTAAEEGGASSAEMAPSMSKDRDSLLHQAVANRSTSRGSTADAGLGQVQGQGAAGQDGLAAAGVERQSELRLSQLKDQLVCHCESPSLITLLCLLLCCPNPLTLCCLCAAPVHPSAYLRPPFSRFPTTPMGLRQQ